jgi:hypothetical protein
MKLKRKNCYVMFYSRLDEWENSYGRSFLWVENLTSSRSYEIFSFYLRVLSEDKQGLWLQKIKYVFAH